MVKAACPTQRFRKGFTLVELLIVVVIIGILVSLFAVNLVQSRQRAFTTAAQTCASSVARAQEIYAIDNVGAYTDFAGLEAAGAGVSDSLQCGDVTVDDTAGAWDAGGWTATHDSGGLVVTFGPGGF